MTTQCNYLYGVTRNNAAASLDAVAGLDGKEVRLIPYGPLAMVTSPADPIRFAHLAPEKTLHYLADHQRVLEQVMEGAPVLPVKFGTYAADAGQVVGILESGREEFTRGLNRYGDKVEMDLVAWWTDLGPVLGELAGDPTVVEMKGRIDGAGTMDDRIRLGRLVKDLLDRRRSDIAGELTAALAPDWSPLVANSVKDDSMILNVATLVGRGQEGRFDQAVDGLNARYEERLSFRRIGPLPPYSFATVEVTFLGDAELDAARQTLELGEYASLDEIKAACRRLLREHHPDRNGSADSTDKIEQITVAYGLLERFARNYRHRLTGPGGPGMPIVKVSCLADLAAAARARKAVRAA